MRSFSVKQAPLVEVFNVCDQDIKNIRSLTSKLYAKKVNKTCLVVLRSTEQQQMISKDFLWENAKCQHLERYTADQGAYIIHQTPYGEPVRVSDAKHRLTDEKTRNVIAKCDSIFKSLRIFVDDCTKRSTKNDK